MVEARRKAPREKGPEGVRALGHRAYVGGADDAAWWGIGHLQFRFLVDQGLRPRHVFLDCACGSLRAGIWLIPFLAQGNYLGIDLEPDLIARGRDDELGPTLDNLKKPELIADGAFTFSRFSRQASFGIAQSLFTHLTSADIALCLRNLAAWAAPDIRFYATFFEGDSGANGTESHAHRRFVYSRDELTALGDEAGLSMSYIGDWRHPRQQKMVCYTRR